MKKLLLVLVFIQSNLIAGIEEGNFEKILCSHDITSGEIYEHSMGLCMEIWTELDLLGAIRTSTEDLMYFADKIIDNFLVLQRMLLIVKGYHDIEPYSYDDMENISDLTRQIDDRFYDIFSTISSKEVICCMVLIERLLNQLEDFSFRNTM